jgi:hypothetical protein
MNRQVVLTGRIINRHIYLNHMTLHEYCTRAIIEQKEGGESRC